MELEFLYGFHQGTPLHLEIEPWRKSQLLLFAFPKNEIEALTGKGGAPYYFAECIKVKFFMQPQRFLENI